MKTWLQQILCNTICCLFLLFECLMWKLLFIDCVVVVFSVCLSSWWENCCSLCCCCLFLLFKYLMWKLLFIDCVAVVLSCCLSTWCESCCLLIVLLSFLFVWVLGGKAVVYWLCCCCLFLLFEFLVGKLLFIDCVVVVFSFCLSSW